MIGPRSQCRRLMALGRCFRDHTARSTQAVLLRCGRVVSCRCPLRVVFTTLPLKQVQKEWNNNHGGYWLR